MADISRPTDDVTQWDSTGTYPVSVNDEGEALSVVQSQFQDGVDRGKGFAVNTPLILIGVTTETDFLLLSNPTGSGKTVKIQHIMGVNDNAAGSIAQGAILTAYRDPTITTNGTAITIAKLQKSQAASSVCSAYYTPTISARGTVRFRCQLMSTNFWTVDQSVQLEANETMLITLTPQTKNYTWGVTLRFIEV